MNTAASLLVDSYLAWIRDSVTAEALNDQVVELTSPFLDRHSDYLQIYAEHRAGDGYVLTDDGYVLSELKSSGVEHKGQRREELIAQLISGYGVTIVGSELQVWSTSSDLGQRAHNLLQAMLSVDDMFVLSQPTIGTIFLEDVAKFLDDRDIRYTPSVKFSGKSGLDHLVDFVIPKSRLAPERIVQVVNSARRDRVASILFAINDTREIRGRDTNYYAVLNDTRREVSAEVVHALEEYSVIAQVWSQREQLVDALAA